MENLSDALRVLSFDQVEQAKSGHPGAPMGMAEMAEVLWLRYLKFNPKNPNWVNRDRFVLSNGHASALLYSLLYLTGYDLPVAELKNFRQLHSKTPGHPELGQTPGVDTTTGPLGQGLGNAVGFALAEKLLATEFNREGHEIIDHYTYVFLGDGCLMEGISHEVCSLAGVWGLNKLILLYDCNGISIDGKVQGWFDEDVGLRFQSYHWNVIVLPDGHNHTAINHALREAKHSLERPTIIICPTTIGKGSPNKAGTAEMHGTPMGSEETELTRKNLNWPWPPFVIPDAIKNAWDCTEKGRKVEKDWLEKWHKYAEAYPEMAKELERRLKGEPPKEANAGWQKIFARAAAETKDLATRKASQLLLDQLIPLYPELLGGSADLTPSNLTQAAGSKEIRPKNFAGNYIHYGVREFGMATILNGLSAHGGFRPYGGTFLVFSDYQRNAIRVAAIMHQPVIFVLTHDSIGVGEDGPTHQPIEHIASLRLIPNLSLWRPADLTETAVAWQAALHNKTGPTALVLSRQNLPQLKQTPEQVALIARGAYVVFKPLDTPQIVILASGSEVSLGLAVKDQLAAQKIHAQVVSMPESKVFDRQDQAYQQSVLPPRLPVFAFDAANPQYFQKYVGPKGMLYGLESFGYSGKPHEVYAAMGLTVDNLTKLARALVK